MTFDSLVHLCNEAKDGDKPDKTNYWNDGELQSEVWCKREEIHRDGDKPAIIQYTRDGVCYSKQWFKNGVRHRENNPAVIEYYDNGKVSRLLWFREGWKHREDGPAQIEYNSESKIIDAQYILNGRVIEPGDPLLDQIINNIIMKELGDDFEI